MNAMDRIKLFLVAAAVGDESAVARLLAEGVLVDDTVDGGRTAFDVAVTNGHAAVVALLADAGADPEQPVGPRRVSRPLQLAALRGNADLVEVLLTVRDQHPDAGGDYFRAGGLALAKAAACGTDRHRDVVDVLLRWGVDVDIRMRGMTALEWAARRGHEDMVLHLLGHGATPTVNAVGLARLGERRWPQLRARLGRVADALVAAGAAEPGDAWREPSSPGPSGTVIWNHGGPVGGVIAFRAAAGGGSAREKLDRRSD